MWRSHPLPPLVIEEGLPPVQVLENPPQVVIALQLAARSLLLQELGARGVKGQGGSRGATGTGPRGWRGSHF